MDSNNFDIQESGLLSPNQSYQVDDYEKYVKIPERARGPVKGESMLVIGSGSGETNPQSEESLMRAGSPGMVIGSDGGRFDE